MMYIIREVDEFEVISCFRKMKYFSLVWHQWHTTSKRRACGLMIGVIQPPFISCHPAWPRMGSKLGEFVWFIFIKGLLYFTWHLSSCKFLWCSENVLILSVNHFQHFKSLFHSSLHIRQWLLVPSSAQILNNLFSECIVFYTQK